MTNTNDLFQLMDVFLGSDKLNGLMVLGGAGIGKTFNVMNYLDKHKIDFSLMRTYTTPLALFMWLWEHKDDKLIVMDDVDGIWDNDFSAAILKSALWEVDGERRIEWHSSSRTLDKSGIPFEFLFNAKIIFICNKTRDNPNVDAVLSRVLYYKFIYTRKELIDEMKKICEHFTGYSLDKPEKLEVVEVIDKMASVFDFRTLMQGFAIKEHCKLNNKKNWKSIFITVLEGDINKELKLVFELVNNANLTVEQQVREYEQTTGKSRRMFFYQKKKLRESGCL
jgi:hypothetical protein